MKGMTGRGRNLSHRPIHSKIVAMKPRLYHIAIVRSSPNTRLTWGVHRFRRAPVAWLDNLAVGDSLPVSFIRPVVVHRCLVDGVGVAAGGEGAMTEQAVERPHCAKGMVKPDAV